MNRQTLRSNMSTDAELDQHHSDGSTSNGLNVSSLAEDGKDLAERSYAYATRTIRENPTLVLAGVLAVGALAAVALKPRRTEPRTIARSMQRDLIKHSRDVRRAVRDEIRNSGASDKFNDLSKTLAAVDWKPYIQPLIDQATAAAQMANDRLTGKTK